MLLECHTWHKCLRDSQHLIVMFSLTRLESEAILLAHLARVGKLVPTVKEAQCKGDQVVTNDQAMLWMKVVSKQMFLRSAHPTC